MYRLESSSGYYGLFKRGGKQIRRSLKTTDAALARRRLAAVREKVARLNQTKGSSRITFAELADRWLTNARVSLKESSASRLAVCLKGLKPYFCGMTVRNVTHRQWEAWANKRGKSISASSYKHERRVITLRRKTDGALSRLANSRQSASLVSAAKHVIRPL